jgi:hypothetical protein
LQTFLEDSRQELSFHQKTKIETCAQLTFSEPFSKMSAPSEPDSDHPVAPEDRPIQTKEKQSRAKTFAPVALFFASSALVLFFALSPAPYSAARVTPLEHQQQPSPSAPPLASPAIASSPAIHESSPADIYTAGTADQPGSTPHSYCSAGQRDQADERSPPLPPPPIEATPALPPPPPPPAVEAAAALAVVDPARASPDKGTAAEAAARASGNGSALALAEPPARVRARLLSQLTRMSPLAGLWPGSGRRGGELYE